VSPAPLRHTGNVLRLALEPEIFEIDQNHLGVTRTEMREPRLQDRDHGCVVQRIAAIMTKQAARLQKRCQRHSYPGRSSRAAPSAHRDSSRNKINARGRREAPWRAATAVAAFRLF
jgi:hypothetical protein